MTCAFPRLSLSCLVSVITSYVAKTDYALGTKHSLLPSISPQSLCENVSGWHTEYSNQGTHDLRVLHVEDTQLNPSLTRKPGGVPSLGCLIVFLISALLAPPSPLSVTIPDIFRMNLSSPPGPRAPTYLFCNWISDNLGR